MRFANKDASFYFHKRGFFCYNVTTLHREADNPSLFYMNNRIKFEWHKKGLLHRISAPAIVGSEGAVYYRFGFLIKPLDLKTELEKLKVILGD